MKRFASCAMIAASVIVAVVSLAFIFIEGRILFSFDWSLYQQPFVGFLQHLARFCLSLFSLSIGFNTIRYRHQGDFIFEGAALTAMGLGLSIFATNYVGLGITAVAILYLIFAIVHYFISKEYDY